MSGADVVEALRSLLGPERVRTDAEALDACARDTWPLRLVQAAVGDAPLVRPLCVVSPRSTAEVSSLLARLHELGAPVVPRGGGSGVGGGAEPGRHDAVVVDLAELRGLVEFDADNLLVTARAGTPFRELTALVEDAGFVLGHYPQSIELAQLGGLVATRSAGQFSTRYGGIEELVLEVEAVLQDGSVVRAGGIPRRAAGPDLRQLWIGSEGSLGIVTEVTLRLFRAPAAHRLAAYALPSFAAGLDAVRDVVQAGWRPAVVRLYDELETARGFGEVAADGEAVLLTLAEGADALVAAEAAALEAALEGARPLGAVPVAAWLERRNDVSDFHRFVASGVLVDTIDVAARWTRVRPVYDAVRAALLAEIPELLVASAHASHVYPQGTNLYFIVAAEPPRDPVEVERVYRSIWDAAMRATLAAGGTIAHHHGIGKLRAPWLAAELGSSYELLARVKAALDPDGRMSPGTLLPG